MDAGLKRRRQAFRQAPWRVQVRSTSSTLLLLLALLAIGAMYLAVSAKVAEAGRRVLVLESRRSELMHENALLTARLAEMTAPQVMMARATDLGFQPAGPNDIEYVTVQGYRPADAFVAPRPPGTFWEDGTGLSPAFTETLGEWFTRWMQSQHRAQ